jgi:hypothetical protein
MKQKHPTKLIFSKKKREKNFSSISKNITTTAT